MKEKSEFIVTESNKEISETDERVRELMKYPVVKSHCESLDKQGIKYKIIMLNQSSESKN